MSASSRWKVARLKRMVDDHPLQGKRPDQVPDWVNSKTNVKALVEELARLVVVLEARIDRLEERLGQ